MTTPEKTTKHSFAVGAPVELTGDETRLLVFKEGWNYGMKCDGQVLKVYCDRMAFDSVLAEVKLRAHDVVFDYEHESEGYPYKTTNGPTLAAGWIDWNTGFEYVDGEGLYVTVKWVEGVLDLIRAKKYRYFSPSFNSDATTGRIFSISSLALTNQPAMLQMKPIAASAMSANDMTPAIFSELGLAVTCNEGDVLAAIKELKKRHEPGATQMSTATMNDNDVSIAAAKLLGLEGVTDADSFKAAFKAIADAKTTHESQFKATNDKVAALTTANEKLAEDNKAMNAKLADIQSKWAKRDEDDFIKRGMAEGKIATTNESLFRVMFSTQGAEKAEEALKGAPVVVSVGGRVSASAAAGSGSSSGNCGTAKAEMEKAVADEMKANTVMTKAEAWSAVCKKNPELRQRLVAEGNEKKTQAA